MNKEYEEWLSNGSKAEVNDEFEKRKEKERESSDMNYDYMGGYVSLNDMSLYYSG